MPQVWPIVAHGNVFIMLEIPNMNPLSGRYAGVSRCRSVISRNRCHDFAEYAGPRTSGITMPKQGVTTPFVLSSI
jgi:hypothetical protein